MKDNIQVEIIDNPEIIASTDYERSLFNISNEIDTLSSHTDKYDYLRKL